jgi:hypothetical protein
MCSALTRIHAAIQSPVTAARASAGDLGDGDDVGWPFDEDHGVPVAVRFGDRQGQPGFAAHVALPHRSGHGGQPEGRPAPDEGGHGGMGAAIGTAGPDDRESAAAEVVRDLAAVEPPLGRVGAGGGGSRPGEGLVLQRCEHISHAAVLRDARLGVQVPRH